MSRSFVLQTVIYYSFSLIDVYELEHKMILKCPLIEVALDSATGVPKPRRPHQALEARPPLHSGLGGSTQDRAPSEPTRAGAEEIRRFIFMDSEGGKEPHPHPSPAPWPPRASLCLTFKGPAPRPGVWKTSPQSLLLL